MAVEHSLDNQIQDAFQKIGIGKLADDLLRRCSNLSKSVDLSPTKLADSWEAFSLNRSVTQLDDKTFDAFRKQVIKESDIKPTDLGSGAVMSRVKRSITNVVTPSIKSKRVSGAIAQPGPFVDRSLSRISLSPSHAVGPALSTKPLYSERRQDAGKEVATYNPKSIPSVDVIPSSSPRCSVSKDQFETNVKVPQRHMFTVLEERSLRLNKMIEEKHTEFSEKFDFGSGQIAAIHPVGVPSQDTICCIGRICNSASEGRLNASSVMLEGSRSSSDGCRVEVDLSHLKSQNQSYSLFPGQIVAVEGVNTTGRKLVAHRICEGAAFPANQTSVAELLKYHHDDSHQSGSPLKIMTASGPFTSTENLDYEPFSDFLAEAVQAAPDVLILMGPFVDMRHKSIASGSAVLKCEDEDDILVSNEILFKERISALLADMLEEDSTLHTHVVLVPSVYDATAEWVYPQAPFTDKRPGGATFNIDGAAGIINGTHGLHEIETGSVQRIHCVSNPCTLKINEIKVGISSNDTIFDISGNEINNNLQGSRLARIMQHMLQQRSYYPLFPAPPETNLNLKQSDQWKLPCALDLLIVPSKLATFARSVLDGDTLVVNPGELTKDTVGGTYATIDVHPMSRESLDSAGDPEAELKHHIGDRTAVSIKKI